MFVGKTLNDHQVACFFGVISVEGPIALLLLEGGQQQASRHYNHCGPVATFGGATGPVLCVVTEAHRTMETLVPIRMHAAEQVLQL